MTMDKDPLLELDKDQLIEVAKSMNAAYLGAMVELQRYRDQYDKVRGEDLCSTPKAKGYVINVASNKNGVGYGAWSHIDGFSEACVDYIIECEHQLTGQ